MTGYMAFKLSRHTRYSSTYQRKAPFPNLQAPKDITYTEQKIVAGGVAWV